MSESKFTRTARRETGLIEHHCQHGVGHPAYGSIDWMERVTGQKSWGVHGCDGCCQDPEWILEDLREGIRVANSIIEDQHEYIDYLRDIIDSEHVDEEYS